MRTPRIASASFDPRGQIRVHADHVSGVVVVVDAFGSSSSGAVGAEVVRDALARVPVHDWDRLDEATACAALQAAVNDASRVLRRAWDLAPTYQGMGASLAAVWLLDGFFVMGHVGDVAIYRVRGGRAEALTRDHGLWHDVGEPGVRATESFLTRALGHHLPCDAEPFASRVDRAEVLVLATAEVALAFGRLGVLEVVRQEAPRPEGLPARVLDQARALRRGFGRGACASLWFDSDVPHPSPTGTSPR